MTEEEKQTIAMENELMAECMDMVRLDLIDAGVISESVPPIMVFEAVMSAIHKRVNEEREACAKACEDAGGGWYFAEQIRNRKD